MESVPLKRCSRCREEKPLSAFGKDKHRPDGLVIYCRRCVSIRKPENILEPAPDGMKRCWDCREVRPATLEFWNKDASKPDGLLIYCKSCRRVRADAARAKGSTSTPTTKSCKKCDRTFPATTDYFQKRPGYSGDLDNLCKECKSTEGRIRFVEDGHHWCPGCRQILPLTTKFFAYRPTSKTGFRSRCKVCESAILFKNLREAIIYCVSHGLLKREGVGETVKTRLGIQLIYKVAASHIRAVGQEIEASLTVEQLTELYELQEARCIYCGTELGESWHLEHVIPLSRRSLKPTHTVDNVACACETCNLQKMARTPEEWSSRWYQKAD